MRLKRGGREAFLVDLVGAAGKMAPLFCFALLTCACSSGSAGGGPGTFPDTPLATETSDGARFDVAIWTSPTQPPERGNNELKLVVTDAASGEPVDGLNVQMVPWMPAMGHGTSVTPSVTPRGAGVYILEDVALYMPGEWQLRTTFTDETTDRCEPTFDIP